MSAQDRDHMMGVGAIFAASIVWGTTGTAATFAPDVGAAAIGAAAMGLGGLLQAAIAAPGIARSANQLAAQWRYLALGGVAVAIYPLAFYASMRLAGVTIGTVISLGLAPLFAAVIEYFFDGLRLTKRWGIGVLLGVCGVGLLSFAEGAHAAPGNAGNTMVFGVLLGLVAGLAYSLYSWSARRLMQRKIASTVAMGATFGIGGLLLMPVLLATGAPFLASWSNAAVGIYMAAIPMFLGYVCFGYGLARVQASTATVITLLEPVVAAGLALLIVGERLPLSGWVGVTLVVACLIVISLPGRTVLKTPAASAPLMDVP